MKRFAASALTALIAVSALSAPAAASAQSRQPQRPQVHAPAWQTIGSRQSTVERLIAQGVRSRSISQREASGFRAQYRQIVNLESRFRRGGFSAVERRQLEQRYDRLTAGIRSEMNDRGGRGDHRSDRGGDRGRGRDGRRN